MRLLLGWATADEGLPSDFVQVPGLAWVGIVTLLGVAFALLGAAWPAFRASRAVIADAVRLE